MPQMFHGYQIFISNVGHLFVVALNTTKIIQCQSVSIAYIVALTMHLSNYKISVALVSCTKYLIGNFAKKEQLNFSIVPFEQNQFLDMYYLF